MNAPAAAALLEEFGVGPPNDNRILARNPDSDDVRAWMLYTLTQPGLDKPTAYVVKRLLTGESPPARFREWARLTPDQWRTLWRAGHYGDLYPAPPDLAEALDDWLEDFGDVFPDGPFGDGHQIAAEWSEWRTQRRQGQRREEPERDPSVNTMIGDVTAAQLWSAALDDLQRQMTQSTFDAWLRDSKLVRYKDDVFIVGVVSEYAKDWLEHRLFSIVERTLDRLTGQTAIAVEFVVLEEK